MRASDRIKKDALAGRSYSALAQSVRLGIFATLLALLFFADRVGAQIQKSNWHAQVSRDDLYEQCVQAVSLDDALVGSMICLGFIIGIADAGGHGACLPKGVKSSEIRNAVVVWMRTNPSTRHDTAAYVVARALEDAYPCP